MSKQRAIIGHLCSKGHFDFEADPANDGVCTSHHLGEIVVEFDTDWWPEFKCRGALKEALDNLTWIFERVDGEPEQPQEPLASQKDYCPRCYEDVEHEDDHLQGDKDVNCWYECPGDERPVA